MLRLISRITTTLSFVKFSAPVFAKLLYSTLVSDSVSVSLATLFLFHFFCFRYDDSGSSEEDVETWFHDMDADKDQHISFEEYRAYFLNDKVEGGGAVRREPLPRCACSH